MKRPDEAVRTVLEGLRRTDVPDGMEERILRGVRDSGIARRRDSEAAGRALLRARATRRFAAVCSVAVAGVLAVVLAGRGMRRFEGAWERPKVALAPVVSVPRPGLSGTEAAAPHAAATRVERVTVEQKARRVRVHRDEKAAALRDAHAASFPAPPLPLTEQERLLLRVVHTGARDEIAMLDPEVRAKEEAARKAEFKEFFPEPPNSNQ